MLVILEMFEIQKIMTENFSDSKYDINEKEFLLDFEKLEKQLPVRISYPVGEGQFPIIVFSHGNGSEGSMYKGFTDKWASHGYVVIQPTHMDSSSLGFQMKVVIKT